MHLPLSVCLPVYVCILFEKLFLETRQVTVGNILNLRCGEKCHYICMGLVLYFSRRKLFCWFLVSDKAGFMEAVEKAVQALVRNVGSGLMKVRWWFRSNS